MRAGFYWKAYSKYLRDIKDWSSSTISQLDESTDEVVHRLSDPTRTEAFQSKGLVVGYVQSGKTAHFSGVLAKAADSGYRLIIVLGGTLDILRSQTQRRIDKELVGKELLENDYSQDPDYGDFLSHGGKPSEMGSFDWERLTGKDDDYKKAGRHIKAMDFQTTGTEPFNAATNLYNKPVRVIVIKKNPKRLTALNADLMLLINKLKDVPALIIDDESDLASINTVDPKTAILGNIKKRTSTNQVITDLLQILPRAQYLGYTATPFANVFIDPSDAEDLFPKDYIVSLPRPEGYMGAADFYDLDTPPPGFNSNERAFIRNVRGQDCGGDIVDNKLNPNHLQIAIDTFILAGAIKLYREQHGYKFKHHTMLVHHSVSTTSHGAMFNIVSDQFKDGGYRGGPGLTRLQELFVNDFQKVSSAKEPNLPFPKKFKDLGPHIMECIKRLEECGPVRIVNGDGTYASHTPDFDKEHIWAILVGGTKLSRGYTVEGLTVSYFRRVSSTTDTLMQMGRWFGYRLGYKDLVRLFIGRNEAFSKTQKLDLYEAFLAICMDEEKFREEIQKYRLHGLTPKQVPPLVPSHLTRLLPTAKNKMFNARIEFKNLGGSMSQPTGAPKDPKFAEVNEKAALKLLGKSPLKLNKFCGTRVDLGNNAKFVNFECKCSIVGNSDILEFLKTYLWSDGKPVSDVADEISFLIGQGEKDPKVKDWLVMTPILASAKNGYWPDPDDPTSLRIPIYERSRVGERFGVYSDPDHIAVARYISDTSDKFTPSPGDKSTSFKDQHRGVIVVYPVVPKKLTAENFTSIGFAILFPKNNIASQIQWSVKKPSNTVTVPI